MAAFLAIKCARLEWAGKERIVERDDEGLYHPEIVTAQWLNYERSSRARGGNHRSAFERERVRLTRAKAEAAERKLALLDHALVGTGDIVERVKTVSLRIRNKLLTSLPRIARSCYSASSVSEAIQAVRREFDVLIAELSALEEGGKDFEGVHDENGCQRSSSG